jgi:hypothetical protein
MLLGSGVALDAISASAVGIEQLRNIGPTPSAAGPRAEALAHLSRAAGLLQPQEVQELPLGDVKAKADFVVEFHDDIL